MIGFPDFALGLLTSFFCSTFFVGDAFAVSVLDTFVPGSVRDLGPTFFGEGRGISFFFSDFGSGSVFEICLELFLGVMTFDSSTFGGLTALDSFLRGVGALRDRLLVGDGAASSATL